MTDPNIVVEIDRSWNEDLMDDDLEPTLKDRDFDRMLKKALRNDKRARKQAKRIRPADGMYLAMIPVVRKMPEPITIPTMTMVESKRPSWRKSCAGCFSFESCIF